MGDNIIVLEVIIERASAQHIADLCNNLTNAYYNTNATAGDPYTFGWGAENSFTGDLKITVGSVGLLVTYNGSTQQVEAIGTCGSGDFDSLSVLEGTMLQYSNGGFTFTVQFELVDGASIDITVKPSNNTTIDAAD